MADAQDENVLSINFTKGINEYADETLLGIDEAVNAQNINVDSGVLTTINEPTLVESGTYLRLAKYFSGDDVTLKPLTEEADYLNYQDGDTEVMLVANGSNVRVYDGSSYRDMENRRVENIDSLNIPALTPYVTVSVGGGTKENSIKVKCAPSLKADNVMYIKRTAAAFSIDCGDPVPYDVIPYKSEADILDTYVGEYITIIERGTELATTSQDGTQVIYVKQNGYVITGFVQFPVTQDRITTKVITPTTFAEDVPKGNLIELNHERVWLAGDPSNPNRLYFSKDMDFDDWTIPTSEGESNQHGGLLDLPTWDGGYIIGLRVLFSDLFVFKPKHIFRVFGTYPGNYSIEQVCTMQGTISDRSIAASPSAVFFAAEDGIYAFNGTNASLISQKIKKTWESLNKDYLKNAVGIFYKNKYYLAVPEGSSTVNNLIIEYNTESQSFVLIRGLTIKDFMEFKGYMYFCNNTGIYNMFQSDRDCTTGYEAEWTSGKLNFGATNARKSVQRVYFLGSGSGNIQFTLTNEKGKTKTLDIALTADEKFYRKRLKNKGRTLKLGMSSVNGSKFKIKDLQIVYEADPD